MPVRFYVMAMLFIVFDVELAFLFPWAVVFRSLGMVWISGNAGIFYRCGRRIHLRLEDRRTGMGIENVTNDAPDFSLRLLTREFP